MTRTQLQLPQDIYERTKAFAEEREISMAEVFRHAIIEYMNLRSTALKPVRKDEWEFPVVMGHTCIKDPCADPDWRGKLYDESTLERYFA